MSKSASCDSLDDLNSDQAESGDSAVPTNVQDLIPRVDLTPQITETLLAELEDKNWKVRNEGLTKLATILAEAKLIKPNLGDLPPALVHRLGDSNTKLAQTTLGICESLAKAMGPPCRQYVRTFFPSFLQHLGDNKSWMRQAAKDTINAYADQCGYREFFESEMVGDALKSGSPIMRVELWAWLAEILPKGV